MKNPKTNINKKVSTRCPGCNNGIYIGQHPKLGDLVVCNHCYLDLEIVKLNPIILDWAVFETRFYYDEDGIKIR
jgi:lysine biosynthesis protein LysW